MLLLIIKIKCPITLLCLQGDSFEQAIKKGNMNTLDTKEITIILNNPTHKNVKHNSKLSSKVLKTCKLRRKVTFLQFNKKC